MQEVVAAEPIRNLINPARIGRYGRPGAPESTPTSTDSPEIAVACRHGPALNLAGSPPPVQFGSAGSLRPRMADYSSVVVVTGRERR
jgi:hypothetical protein